MKALRMLTVLAALVGGAENADAKPRREDAAYACRHHARWTHNEVRCAISRVWAGSRHRRDAMSVASCESGFNAYEVMSSGASGVFQVIPRYHQDAPNVFDPVAVSRWVRQITRDGRDWSSWVCQPGGGS